jgi:hypothetical protein
MELGGGLHLFVYANKCIARGRAASVDHINMASDLSALLTASKSLTSHLSRPDLPSVHLSLDEVEAQSRRLVSRQPGTSSDTDRAYVSAIRFC